MAVTQFGVLRGGFSTLVDSGLLGLHVFVLVWHSVPTGGRHFDRCDSGLLHSLVLHTGFSSSPVARHCRIFLASSDIPWVVAALSIWLVVL